LKCWTNVSYECFKKSVANFLPDLAPEWLNPFVFIIEKIRFMVRPIMLSFRLAANIAAGHIELTLISLITSRWRDENPRMKTLAL